MKKIVTSLLILTLLFSLLSCAQGQESTGTTGPEETQNLPTATVIISGEQDQVIVLDLSTLEEGATLYDAIKSEAYRDQFQADIAEGESPFLNGLCDLTPGENQYIAIYTDDSAFTFGDPVEIKGHSYCYASVGIADLVLKDGAQYLLCVETFNF